MPRGQRVYGCLTEQLEDTNSFALRMREVVHVSGRYRIANRVQVVVADVSDKAMLGMIHLLDTRQLQVTVLNFANQPIAGRVNSEHLAPGAAVIDMCTDQVIAEVDPEHTFAVSLKPHQGMALLTDPVDALGRPSRRQPI